MKRLSTFDSDPQAALSFLVQQAAVLEQQAYAIEYPQYRAEQLIDVDTGNEGNQWVKSILYRISDTRGKIGWLGDESSDINTVSTGYDMASATVHTSALGYTFTLAELAQAQALGTNLEVDKVAAVTEITNREVDKLALVGDEEIGITGLFNNDQVSVFSAPSTISQMVASQQPEQIVNLFATLYNNVYIKQTNTIHRPTHFTMPPEQFALLSQSFVSFNNASNISYLQILRISFPDCEFEDNLLLKGAGGSGQDRICLHKKNPRCVKMHMPMKLRFLQPTPINGISFLVPSITRTSGTEIRIPKTLAYADGV